MLDANGASPGLPWTLINETETTHEINILHIPKTEAEKFIAKYPLFMQDVIPREPTRATRTTLSRPFTSGIS